MGRLGKRPVSVPSIKPTSLWQIPAPLTSSTSSPGPGAGSETSCNARGWFSVTNCQAFMSSPYRALSAPQCYEVAGLPRGRPGAGVGGGCFQILLLGGDNPDYPAIAEGLAARLDAEDAARELSEPPTASALPTTDAVSLGRQQH